MSPLEGNEYSNQKISKSIKDPFSLKSIAFKLHKSGNTKEALKYYKSFVSFGYSDAIVFTNYGALLQDSENYDEAKFLFLQAIEIEPEYALAYYNLGTTLICLNKFHEAEIALRKSIQLDPKLTKAYYNLSTVLLDFGKFKEVEILLLKSIELNPNFVKSYFVLSSLKKYLKNNQWIIFLFSKKIIENKSYEDLVDIYFARANILHGRRNFKESSKYLELANNIKVQLYPSTVDFYIKRSKDLYLEQNIKEIKKTDIKTDNQNIFIVGMPRSGTTLLENILSMNNKVFDLGEVNILEETYLEKKEKNNFLNFHKLYLSKIKIPNDKFTITTNKWLYNYQYIGVISNNIINNKIIHCLRNPLDNILSIYRANFAKGNEYSSSIEDCTRVYLDHEETISKYKKIFKEEIYNLNYDLLVTNPDIEIKSLISWLGWKWNDNYLSPHLNSRIVSTASSIQVRSPITNKSVGGWREYQDLLKPAIKILQDIDRYNYLF